MSTCKPLNRTVQDNFTYLAKAALLRQRKTITELAASLKLSRNAVSRAINHPVLPTVRRRIKKTLSL